MVVFDTSSQTLTTFPLRDVSSIVMRIFYFRHIEENNIHADQSAVFYTERVELQVGDMKQGPYVQGITLR